MKSSYYQGDIYHKRFTPKVHEFRYELGYLFLDLADLDAVFNLSPFWSLNRRNLVSFNRQDYLPGDRESLLDEAHHRVRELGGTATIDRIYLLATPRCLGHCLNPISLYYCYSGEDLQYVLAEVNNTPWDERHVYLLSDFDEPTEKGFHVSPFMPMDTTYQWKIGDPDDRFVVAINVQSKLSQLFTASMTLQREDLTRDTANKHIRRLLRQSFRTVSAIYWQALVLWIKKVPFYRHPKKKALQDPA